MRHAAHSPSAREGVFRGGSWAAGRSATRNTRRNRRHPGKNSLSLGYIAHSGSSPGGMRESRYTVRLGGLPEEGFHSALRDRWQLGRHPGEILPVRGIRGRVAAREESGRWSVSLCTRNTWRVPRAFRRRLSEGLAAGFRGHKSFFERVFRLNLRDRHQISEGRSGRGFGGVFEWRHSAGLREGFEDGKGLPGTRVRFRRVSEGESSGLVGSKGFPEEVGKVAFGGSFERVVFANFHGGRLGSLDPRSTAPVGRLVRTGAR